MKHWVELGIKNMEKGRKYTFWTFLFHVYWYTLNVYRYTLPELNVYRYTLGVYRYTCCSVPSFNQFFYFGHNLLNSYPICVIQVAN